jgi:hypothetical protein
LLRPYLLGCLPNFVCSTPNEKLKSTKLVAAPKIKVGRRFQKLIHFHLYNCLPAAHSKKFIKNSLMQRTRWQAKPWAASAPLFYQLDIFIQGKIKTTIVPFSNHTAPSSSFLTTVFDELFEVLKIILNPSGNDADSITGIFDKSFRIVRNL